MTDEEVLARELVAMIKQHVRDVTQPLRDCIASLEVQVKFLKESGVHFRGAFEDGQTYTAGDCVMRAGSLWRAHAMTSDRPPTQAWQLMVRKGRDGKDLTNGS